MKPLAIAALLLLAGCATPEPKIETVPVDMPVAKSCVPDNLAPAPGKVDPKTGKTAAPYADSDQALKAADPITAFKLLVEGRKQRNDRLDQIEPVIALCK